MLYVSIFVSKNVLKSRGEPKLSFDVYGVGGSHLFACTFTVYKTMQHFLHTPAHPATEIKI